MKACTLCNEVKPLADFYFVDRRRLARHSRCQPCRRQQFKAYARTDQGKRVKRSGVLRRDYKISEAEYEALNLKQGGLCLICEKSETKTHRDGSLLRLSVDHNHATGNVRALLCQACNVGLGSFKDDPQLLIQAAAYLKSFAV